MVTLGTSIYTKKCSQVTAPAPCPRRRSLNFCICLWRILQLLQEATSWLSHELQRDRMQKGWLWGAGEGGNRTWGFKGHRVLVLQDENEFCGWVMVMAAMVKMITLIYILLQLKKKKKQAPPLGSLPGSSSPFYYSAEWTVPSWSSPYLSTDFILLCVVVCYFTCDWIVYPWGQGLLSVSFVLGAHLPPCDAKWVLCQG